MAAIHIVKARAEMDLLTHKGTVTLETARLILRRYVPEDADAMFRNWTNDPEVTRFLTWQPHGSIDVTRKISLSDISKYDNLSHYQWAIVPKSLNEPIGGINVVNMNEPCRCFEIGYRIGRAWWRQGFASEALSTVIKFLFEQVGANRIAATYDTRNPNSGAVMRKCGMRYEGILRQSGRNNQGVYDAACYAILAEDYFAASPQKTETANANAVKIIPYEEKYRDDMIFCFLSAKDALSKLPNGRPLSFKTELLDISGVYLSRGDVFYLAIDENDRVVGMIGTETISSTELWLKRLFIKPEVKGNGIGSKLFAAVEKYASGKGITVIHTRFADWYTEAARFYPAKGFIDAGRDDYLVHMIKRYEK
jgi:ribosomal-protein-alanine N-acetyltransferase